MTVKWIGAVMIAVSCAGYGFMITYHHRREVASLRQLMATLEWMICELQYRLTPLPELCRLAAGRGGLAASIFSMMAVQLEESVSADAGECMRVCVKKQKNLPLRLELVFMELGQSLGRFSLNGQITELKAAVEMCRRELKGLEAGQESRLRSYRTLGICAGAALIILFL